MAKEIKKYLGIDWGLKRIGLSLGDSSSRLATPFKTVNSIDDIAQAVKEEKIDEIILGQPIKLNGVDDEMIPEYDLFLANIKEKLLIPIKFIDERLTSIAADKLSGSKKTKASRDELAAMIILQSYFDQGDE